MKTGTILCISIVFFFSCAKHSQIFKSFFSISTPNIANTIFNGSYTIGYDVNIHVHCSKI